MWEQMTRENEKHAQKGVDRPIILLNVCMDIYDTRPRVFVFLIWLFWRKNIIHKISLPPRPCLIGRLHECHLARVKVFGERESLRRLLLGEILQVAVVL
jgi:hypothetical protein